LYFKAFFVLSESALYKMNGFAENINYQCSLY